ncbi:heterokaryon incompatibility protein-domain-containing protein [Cubamyces lactineus]|nr:heterokaryon incompatibility protein-domain-containing protein [Cubamyces lactineus]
MRLLNTETARLVTFPNSEEIPPYAILSHVWQQHEQSFQDIKALHDDPDRLSHLSEKIRRFCQFAQREGFEWIWVDTCCIDKTSSAELSEAINSMYTWYSEAVICYVYLHDVSTRPNTTAFEDHLTSSVWFTRGWTLQELVAPLSVVFLADDWKLLGTKEQWALVLERRTGIDRKVLTCATFLDDVSVARRMSWAAGRRTTRPEDRAYSLMGIFGVHMTTIYGEGEAKAFRRLQEEILKQCTPDQSIFAWGSFNLYDVTMLRLLHNQSSSHNAVMSGSGSANAEAQARALLAPSPDSFRNARDIVSLTQEEIKQILGTDISIPPPDIRISGSVILITLPLVPIHHWHPDIIDLALLGCRHTNHPGGLYCLYLAKKQGPTSSELYSVGAYTPTEPWAEADDGQYGPWFGYERGGLVYSTLLRDLARVHVPTIYIHNGPGRSAARKQIPHPNSVAMGRSFCIAQLPDESGPSTSHTEPLYRLCFPRFHMDSHRMNLQSPSTSSALADGQEVDIFFEPGNAEMIMSCELSPEATSQRPSPLDPPLERRVLIKLEIGVVCACCFLNPFWIKLAWKIGSTDSAGEESAGEPAWQDLTHIAPVFVLGAQEMDNRPQRPAETLPFLNRQLRSCIEDHWHLPCDMALLGTRSEFHANESAAGHLFNYPRGPLPYPSTCFQFGEDVDYMLRVTFDHWPSYTSPNISGPRADQTYIVKYGVRIKLGTRTRYFLSPTMQSAFKSSHILQIYQRWSNEDRLQVGCNHALGWNLVLLN